ncbi:hypothetical protein EVAR_38595_1 [Eumeta japonica]|uniref:Uncharacterized protein n=1 Tax=Eumeta variegata TaxID=151549 RepID=A0A4C1WRM9_EUMVA|nr:hypothetical protein EVAR_38595_1 [Eumeta japonica]
MNPIAIPLIDFDPDRALDAILPHSRFSALVVPLLIPKPVLIKVDSNSDRRAVTKSMLQVPFSFSLHETVIIVALSRRVPKVIQSPIKAFQETLLRQTLMRISVIVMRGPWELAERSE